jgi:hypothetical protein
MNRISALVVALTTLVIMACIGSESRAGLLQRLFGGGGGACANGMCAAPGGFSVAQSFSMPVASYGAPMMSYNAPVASYGAPLSFGAPTTYGAGGGCYSSSYSAQMQSFSAPATYGAPTTYGAGGGCYSSSYAPQMAYSVPVYRSAPPAQQTQQAAPSPQSQAAPSLPSKTLPSQTQEYSPGQSKSSPRIATDRRFGFRRSIREIKPQETPPTVAIGCGPDCGGENCVCDSIINILKGNGPTRFVDYSGMTAKDILRLVDYNTLSGKGVRTSMR